LESEVWIQSNLENLPKGTAPKERKNLTNTSTVKGKVRSQKKLTMYFQWKEKRTQGKEVKWGGWLNSMKFFNEGTVTKKHN